MYSSFPYSYNYLKTKSGERVKIIYKSSVENFGFRFLSTENFLEKILKLFTSSYQANIAINLHACTYVYIYMHVYMYICIYMYTDR